MSHRIRCKSFVKYIFQNLKTNMFRQLFNIFLGNDELENILFKKRNCEWERALKSKKLRTPIDISEQIVSDPIH